MSLFLWILQIVLALMFVGIGALRLTRSAQQLRKLPWTDDYPVAVIRAVGGIELLAGACLLIPGMMDWTALLTPVAAGGLAVLMALAILVHLRRGQGQAAVLPAILLVMAGVVVWGRLEQLG